MEIRVCAVKTKKEIRRFVSFPDLLYREDPNYTPYIRSDLRKTLSRLLITEKSYHALLACDEKNLPLARVLYTVAKNKQLDTERCGFFSMYECVDAPAVSEAILSAMKKDLISMGATHISGSFSPFDPDNRRGIMVKGFERAPLIFTSYNPPYYGDQLTAFGFAKDTDTYQYTLPFDPETLARVEKMARFSARHCDVRVDHVNWKNIDRDVRDFCAVMEMATTELNYQNAPDPAEIHAILKGWRRFLNPDFILIARRNSDNAPVGIVMAIPDYFEVFRHMKGRTDPIGLLRLLYWKRRIRSLRAMLQYVIPEYQQRGVIAMLSWDLYRTVQKLGYNYVEAGTILENNLSSQSVMNALHGELTRVYRIYSMEL